MVPVRLNRPHAFNNILRFQNAKTYHFQTISNSHNCSLLSIWSLKIMQKCDSNANSSNYTLLFARLGSFIRYVTGPGSGRRSKTTTCLETSLHKKTPQNTKRKNITKNGWKLEHCNCLSVLSSQSLKTIYSSIVHTQFFFYVYFTECISCNYLIVFQFETLSGEDICTKDMSKTRGFVQR